MNESLKYKAGVAALDEVKVGMALGLGTGSTVTHFIRELGNRVRDGLRVTAIATSLQSETLAIEVGVPSLRFKSRKYWILPSMEPTKCRQNSIWSKDWVVRW